MYPGTSTVPLDIADRYTLRYEAELEAADELAACAMAIEELDSQQPPLLPLEPGHVRVTHFGEPRRSMSGDILIVHQPATEHIKAFYCYRGGPNQPAFNKMHQLPPSLTGRQLH